MILKVQDGALVPQGTKPKRKRPNTGNRAAIAGNGAIGRAWRRERKAYLTTHPTCSCGAKATHVHHLDGKGPTGPRGFDWLNLQALCHSCHSRETARLQPGGWNA